MTDKDRDEQRARDDKYSGIFWFMVAVAIGLVILVAMEAFG